MDTFDFDKCKDKCKSELLTLFDNRFETLRVRLNENPKLLEHLMQDNTTEFVLDLLQSKMDSSTSQDKQELVIVDVGEDDYIWGTESQVPATSKIQPPLVIKSPESLPSPNRWHPISHNYFDKNQTQSTTKDQEVLEEKGNRTKFSQKSSKPLLLNELSQQEKLRNRLNATFNTQSRRQFKSPGPDSPVRVTKPGSWKGSAHSKPSTSKNVQSIKWNTLKLKVPNPSAPANQLELWQQPVATLLAVRPPDLQTSADKCKPSTSKARPCPSAQIVKRTEKKSTGKPINPNSTQELMKDFDKVPERPVQVHYKNPPRNRWQRGQMKGWDCKMCRDWYKDPNLTEEEIQAWKNKSSRHRCNHAPGNCTPTPDYWSSKLPSTQESYAEGYIKVGSPGFSPLERKRRHDLLD